MGEFKTTKADAKGTKEVPVTTKRKPPAAGKGRPKGAVNKLTKTIREAVEISFAQIGGADWLVKMADDQPVAYMTLLGKVLPQQVEHTGKDGDAIKMEQVKSDATAFTSAVIGLASRAREAGEA